MQTVHTIADLRAAVAQWRSAGDRVALVPTMGHLHEGHLRLVDRARELADRVIVSIFVNPMQFAPGEDFDRYPRTLEADSRQLIKRDTDLIFAPAVNEVYPNGLDERTKVVVPGLSYVLCGEFRPGHFVGVATVVTKLLNMAQPDVAVFGSKDFQQLMVICWMVTDLCMPIEIEGVTTVREENGLAMSSRNAYLTEKERDTAARLFQTLQQTADRLQAGEKNFPSLESDGLEALESVGFEPDYFTVRRATDLAQPKAADRKLVILVAAYLGNARLIDNLEVTLS